MSDGPRHEANFNEDEYARPNQPFRCGWADEGHACPLGPTKWGLCRSARECAPYKQGDTWLCARTKASGGACEQGPLPDGTCCSPIQRCQPVRNVLSKRGIISLCAFALAVGVGFIMLGARGRRDVASPGDLSAQHRQLAQRCQDCHIAGDGNLSDWIHVAMDGEAARQQSQLCLNCHHELGEHAMQPHGSSTETLEDLTSASKSAPEDGSSEMLVNVAKRIFGSPTDTHGSQTETHVQLGCATCHKEHHGDRSLTDLTNRQCQVCHASSFQSFAVGHPEFDNYVYKRRSRIYFDHVSHYGQHFVEPVTHDLSEGQARKTQSATPAADTLLPDRTAAESKSHSCSSCHVADTSGRYMLVRDFRQSCASCHQDQIEDDTMPGVAVLALPALDLQTLRDKQVDIGEWPESYPQHVQASGRFTPVSKLLMLDGDDFLPGGIDRWRTGSK